MTTHPDQHAVAIGADGTAYFGNDGGVYRHQVAQRGKVSWTSLNRRCAPCSTTTPGSARRRVAAATWSGAACRTTAPRCCRPGLSQMVSPFGGDGGDVLVDPANGENAVNEYVYLNMAVTTNGGRSDGTTRAYRTISPSCVNVEFTPDPCDPARGSSRRTRPTRRTSSTGWPVAQFVWDNQNRGFGHDLRSHGRATGRSSTTSATAHSRPRSRRSAPTTYAGWCGNGCNPGGAAPFVSGIDTNYGGTWHRVSSRILPNRIPTAVTIDPTNAAPRLRDLRRLLAPVDPGRGRRARVRVAQRRDDLDRPQREPARRTGQRPGRLEGQARGRHRRRRVLDVRDRRPAPGR